MDRVVHNGFLDKHTGNPRRPYDQVMLTLWGNGHISWTDPEDEAPSERIDLKKVGPAVTFGDNVSRIPKQPVDKELLPLALAIPLKPGVMKGMCYFVCVNNADFAAWQTNIRRAMQPPSSNDDDVTVRDIDRTSAASRQPYAAPFAGGTVQYSVPEQLYDRMSSTTVAPHYPSPAAVMTSGLPYPPPGATAAPSYPPAAVVAPPYPLPYTAVAGVDTTVPPIEPKEPQPESSSQAVEDVVTPGQQMFNYSVCSNVNICQEDGILTYDPQTSLSEEPPVAQFTSKCILTPEHRSFVVKVHNSGRDGSIGVGIVTKNYPKHLIPGWDHGSVGYHGDDGGLYSSAGRPSEFLQQFSKTLSKVKIEVEFSGNIAKNFLIYVDDILIKRHSLHKKCDWYSCIGLKTVGAQVQLVDHGAWRNFVNAPAQDTLKR